MVVNRKWHSSSSAFPPAPHLVLFVFCPLLFSVWADCDELDGDGGEQRMFVKPALKCPSLKTKRSRPNQRELDSKEATDF